MSCGNYWAMRSSSLRKMMTLRVAHGKSCRTQSEDSI